MIATHYKVDFVKIKIPIFALVIGSSLICFSLVVLVFLIVDVMNFFLILKLKFNYLN